MQLKSIIKYLNFEFIDLYQLSFSKIRPFAENNSNIISCSSEYGYKPIAVGSLHKYLPIMF